MNEVEGFISELREAVEFRPWIEEDDDTIRRILILASSLQSETTKELLRRAIEERYGDDLHYFYTGRKKE